VLRSSAFVGYFATIVAANWLTAEYGLVPVGFGLLATAGTYAAGAAFVARDTLQDTAGRLVALGALVAGAALSWVVASPQLALASAVAFGFSELADMAIYTPLRKRGYIRAAVASNVVGSVVDTFVFLWLAGFGLAPLIVTGQLVGKAWITLGVVMTVALLRHRLRARRA
jgi:uncharacterized PurR-regulated membrane protein YhhQ (DUF165 family)